MFELWVYFITFLMASNREYYITINLCFWSNVVNLIPAPENNKVVDLFEARAYVFNWADEYVLLWGQN